MGAVAVIDRAHHFDIRFATCRAWLLINDMMAGMALVPPLLHRNGIKAFVGINRLLLFWSPVHVD